MPLVITRCSNLNAAQSRNGMHKYASGYVFTGPGNQPPKVIIATRKSMSKSAVISGTNLRFIFSPELHARRNGAKISAPKPSPSHQVIQRYANLFHCAAPPKERLRSPIVALTIGASTAAHKTNHNTLATDLSDLSHRPTLFIKKIASSPSQVFPKAIPNAVCMGPWVCRLAAKAPMKNAGQTRQPNILSELMTL